MKPYRKPVVWPWILLTGLIVLVMLGTLKSRPSSQSGYRDHLSREEATAWLNELDGTYAYGELTDSPAMPCTGTVLVVSRGAVIFREAYVSDPSHSRGPHVITLPTTYHEPMAGTMTKKGVSYEGVFQIGRTFALKQDGPGRIMFEAALIERMPPINWTLYKVQKLPEDFMDLSTYDSDWFDAMEDAGQRIESPELRHQLQSRKLGLAH